LDAQPERTKLSYDDTHDDYPYEAKKRVTALIEALTTVLREDPDAKVQGLALPVLHAVIETIKDGAGRDNPVVQSAAAVISADTVASGDPIRAADALIVARILDGEIGPYPPMAF
jgi:hypothetical protein